MLIYEKLTDTLIRIKLEPSSIYAQSSDSNLKDQNNNKSILLNYYIPEYEMNVYIDLTKGKDNAFEETNRYRLPSEKWVYCKTSKEIEQCSGFDRLKLEKTEGNIYYYNFKKFEKMEKIEGTNLYLAN
jgi:hypothetical protein